MRAVSEGRDIGRGVGRKGVRRDEFGREGLGR